jgi:hypothetical protein
MRKVKIKYFALILIVVSAGLFLITGCSSTKLTAVWKEPTYTNNQPLKKIFVLGIFDRLSSRQVFENEIAELLKQSGTDAIVSLSVMPPNKEYKYNELQSKLESLNVDGILIVRLKELDKALQYMPGYFGFYGAPFGYYRHYYGGYWGFGMSPGYVSEYNIYQIESNLYISKDDKLVYSAESRSVDPFSCEGMADDISKQLVNNMKANGLIK